MTTMKLNLNHKHPFVATHSSVSSRKHNKTRPLRSTITCSLAQDTPTTSLSATQDHTAPAPPSWPSRAARSAAFSSIQQESATNVPAEISGRIPEWLKGQYLRNGPGGYDNATLKGMEHMFDGYALVVKMDIDGSSNTVKGSHEFIESNAYKHYKAEGTMKWREFATPVPTTGIVSKATEMFSIILGSMGLLDGVTDNASVNILPRGEREAWALTETVNGTIAFDPTTLRTLNQIKYTDSLKGDLTTAHPTRLPSGEIINFLSTVGVGFQVYRQSPENPLERQLIATIPHRRPLSPSWVHDFPGTASHIVIPDAPLFFNLGALMVGGSTDHIFMNWDPAAKTKLHVVALKTGEVKTYTVPAFFAFHWANAFESEDGKFLNIDGAIYDDPTILNDLYLDTIRKDYVNGAKGLSTASLARLTIDLQAPNGSELTAKWQPLVKDEAQGGNWFEFPRVSPQKEGQKYRYVWCACAARPTNAGNALAKVDLETGEVKVWTEAGGLVGEPVFIPRPGATSEDDGVALVMLVQADGRAAVLFVDGESHQEVARAILPYKLSNGFHGQFVPSF